MDLTQSVLLGATELNDAAVGAGDVITGCAVETCDYSELVIRQNVNPLAKSDGAEAGGVWVTSRKVVITGTVYGSTRLDAHDRLAALEAVFVPATGQVDGHTTLTFYVATEAAAFTRTLSVRPNGLRHVDLRLESGGPSDSLPLAIPWSATMLAQPAYTDELV